MELTPMNELERKVLEMVKAGQHVYGMAFDVWMEMTLRAMEKET